jgi:hypothetical protein
MPASCLASRMLPQLFLEGIAVGKAERTTAGSLPAITHGRHSGGASRPRDGVKAEAASGVATGAPPSLQAGRASHSAYDFCLELSANFTFALEYEGFGGAFTPSPVPFAPLVFVPKLHPFAAGLPRR